MSRPREWTSEAVVAAIDAVIARLGMPPTLSEIREVLGMRSNRTVLRYLARLEAEGEIVRWPGARGLCPTNRRRTFERWWEKNGPVLRERSHYEAAEAGFFAGSIGRQ